MQTNIVKKYYGEDSTEHIYYDLRLDNLYKDSENSKIASINTKVSNILDKQSDYEMAVTFWNLRGYLPVFICPILEGSNTNINATPYGVCYRYAGVDYATRVIYSPDANTGVYPDPKPPGGINGNGGIQDISSGYYFIFTFEKFIEMVNTALLASYIAFNTANPGVHGQAVYFQYDAETGLISLVAEYSYRDGGGGAEIYMNALLLNYFEGIRVIFYGYDQTNFKDFRFPMVYNYTTNSKAHFLIGQTPIVTIAPAIPPNPPYMIFEQEYDCRYLWANIKSIIFTSSTISVREEFLPNVKNPNATTLSSTFNSAFNPSSKSIISYYDIIFNTTSTSGANWRQYLYYIPQVQKWMDLTSNDALNQFNIEVFIQLTNGQTLPLYIPVNSSIDIKLLFRKKN